MGDEVIGFSDWRNAQAESVMVPSNHVVLKPAALDWDIAGSATRDLGVHGNGMSTVDPRAALTDLGTQIAEGKLTLPIYARYPLSEVRAAYGRLASRHGLGKIVLEVRPAL